MHYINTNKAFSLIFGLLFITISVLVLNITQSIKNLIDLKTEFENLQLRFHSFLIQEVEISKENMQISRRNVQKIYELQQHWLKSFGRFSDSKTPLECYLNLQHDMEILKKNIISANIDLNLQCNFGFDNYLRNGTLPEIQNVANIDLQSTIIQKIVRELIQSQPKELLYVKREALNGELELNNELFSRSFDYTLKIHDIFSSQLLILSFVGTTNSLRLFINKIESIENPIFIRDVEINKFSRSNIPFTDQEYSIFSVILEVVTIKNPST